MSTINDTTTPDRPASGFLPGFDREEAKPKKKRIRPKRHGFDDSEARVGPNGGVLRRGKGKGRRYEDLTGLKFGLWTVIEFSHYNEKAHSKMWVCECECGARQIRYTNVLRQRLYQGCRDCKAKRQRRYAYRGYWQRIKAHAAKRKIPFAISFEETVSLLKSQGFRCALTGLPIDMALSRRAFARGEATASLDRLDSSLGYIPGNVWWVHKDVNRMKWVLSVDRFVDICKRVASIHGASTCQHSAG